MRVILALDAVKYPLTGIGRYTYELARALAHEPDIERLRFFRGTRFCDAVPEPADAPALGSGLRRRLLKSRLAVALYRRTAPRLKARALRGCADHLFHGPNFYLPPFAGRSVVTLHDLSPYTLPDCHPPERVRYMRAELALSLQRAALVITDSAYTRRELMARFDWPAERVRAVPLAGAAAFRPHAPEELEPLRAHYGLAPGGYSLFVGTIEPRKNIGVLLDAYGRLPPALRQRWPLVLSGYPGWNSAALHARIAAAERAGWARYLGYVRAEHLAPLFAGARLFVFPSRYEGFGLPVLEAMASGVPVVCSDSSSLPEVAGTAAAYCRPDDVEGLTDRIAAGLEDGPWRAAARTAGLAQAARFSWQRCARETVAAYRAALAS